MEKDLLRVIKKCLVDTLGLNYQYEFYEGVPAYPYIVGQYDENNFIYENNGTSGTFILTIFSKGSKLELLNIKAKIKNLFGDYRTVENTTGVNVSYRNTLNVPTGVEDLKKIEIYLDTNIWKGE